MFNKFTKTAFDIGTRENENLSLNVPENIVLCGLILLILRCLINMVFFAIFVDF